MKNKRGNVAVIAIIIAIVAIAAGVVGWMFAKKSQTPVTQTTATQQVTTQPNVSTTQPAEQTTPAVQSDNATSIATIPADWKTYTGSKYGFSVSYPSTWKSTELTSANSFREGITFNESKPDPANTYAQLAIFYYTDISGVSYTNKAPKNLDEYMKDPTFKDAKVITFNGEKAFTATDINNNANVAKTDIFVQHQGHIYEINYFNADKDITTTNAVIKTIKFTN
ncbi:MAG TPA: hypothetical protein VF817_02605 [Patescibacteria group bacterium]